MLNWRDAGATLAGMVDWAPDGPGGAVVLFDEQGMRAQAAGGVESLATGTPIGIDSIMRCASVTKHVFASFVLAHPDAIGLDDPLGLSLIHI